MAEISKTERLLNLVSFLLKSRRPVSGPEILGSVTGYAEGGVSQASLERRFERDKAALRELGVPLEFIGEGEPGGPGYVIPREAYFLPRIELTPTEATILAIASRFALAGAAGPIGDALRSALRKLQFDSAIPGDIRETAEEHFLFHRAVEREALSAEDRHLRDATTAVLERRAIRFSYYGIARNRTEKRTVEPYGLGFSNGHWYLVGRDLGRKDVRVFRVDRIRKEIVFAHRDSAQPDFEAPEDFRVQDHIGVPPWLFGRTKRTTVKLRFDAEVAFMVRLRPATGDVWEDNEDGSFTLTRRATNLDALLNWTLGFGRHVQVLDPPEFRARAAEALRAVAAQHATAGRKGDAR